MRRSPSSRSASSRRSSALVPRSPPREDRVRASGGGAVDEADRRARDRRRRPARRGVRGPRRRADHRSEGGRPRDAAGAAPARRVSGSRRHRTGWRRRRRPSPTWRRTWPTELAAIGGGVGREGARHRDARRPAREVGHPREQPGARLDPGLSTVSAGSDDLSESRGMGDHDDIDLCSGAFWAGDHHAGPDLAAGQRPRVLRRQRVGHHPLRRRAGRVATTRRVLQRRRHPARPGAAADDDRHGRPRALAAAQAGEPGLHAPSGCGTASRTSARRATRSSTRSCERGECDFVNDIAARLPMIMIGDALGVRARGPGRPAALVRRHAQGPGDRGHRRRSSRRPANAFGEYTALRHRGDRRPAGRAAPTTS